MLYIKRDANGAILAVSRSVSPEFPEAMELDNRELQSFLSSSEISDLAKNWLVTSDADMVRGIEDVIEVLLKKNILQFTELPGPTQDKLLQRKRMRTLIGGLLSSDDGINI